MRPASTKLVIYAAVLVIAVVACSKKKKEMGDKEYQVLAEYVSPEDSLPKLRFLDSGLVSINDRCAVRKTKLSTKMPAVYVNGQPVGFC